MAGLSPYPICELCNKPVMAELHVDHIEPFEGIDDPRRLDMENLRVTHMRCHMRHTAKEAKKKPG